MVWTREEGWEKGSGLMRDLGSRIHYGDYRLGRGQGCSESLVWCRGNLGLG